MNASEEKDFLTSLFECDDRSDDKLLRYAEANTDVQKLEINASPQSLQSNVAEIFTKIFVKAPNKSRNSCELGDRFGFTLMAEAAGSREEDAIEFLLATFVRCQRELGKENISDTKKKVVISTQKATLSVFVTILRGYLEDQLQSKLACLIFLKKLLEDTISPFFLQSLVEFVSNFEEIDEEALGDVFNPVFDLLRCAMISQNFEENRDEVVHQILRVTQLLFNVRHGAARPLCKLVTSRSDFIPKETKTSHGREFGLLSFLGPFYNYGLISSGRNPNTRVFLNCEEDAIKNDGTVNMEQKQYFQRMGTVRKLLHQLMIPLLSDHSSRSITVKWMAGIVTRNQRRGQTQFESSVVICDHFMANFIHVMYALSEKIDISKVNAFYPFRPISLVNVSKETRINMDEATATSYEKQFETNSTDAENFSTECFFVTISAQQLAFPLFISQINDYTRHIKDLNGKIAALKEKLKMSSSGPERADIERKLQFEQENWKLLSRHLLCLKTLSQDPTLMASSIGFADKQLTFLMNSLCSDLNLMGDDSQLPEKPTQLFSAYPEHYLEDIFDFYSYALSNATHLLMEQRTDWIARLCILFSHYNYINNPFLVAKLVRVLTAIHPPLWFNVVNFRMTQEKFLLCLIKFYSDFEDNGDFYEKFNVRGNIQYMLEKLGQDVFYRAKFMDMAKECGAEFIRFVNMVINDATWCIDESLSGLKSIHDVEKKMSNISEWSRMDQELRTQELDVYEEAKRKVKGWLGTAKSNLKLLLSITETSPEPFRTAVLGERLAAMLNHNLSQLMGNKCVELKVSNPSNYGWHPRQFVSLIISIYLCLNMPSFVKYIAYDERTYNPEFFRSSIERMKKSQILSLPHLERFEHLAEEVQKEYEAKAELEEEYDDVPEEFKDPIMDAIMVDPVALPSGHIMDRAVIERHLLSMPNNPFSRAPLSQSELVPDTELKTKIQNWIAQKRKAKNRDMV
uniref:RING-type E3 ubiquitin transferase n=1 Tax=Caenorhabditis japonica TaxID=281687 RepID=A0A8R1I3P5_CAEJA